MSKDNRISPSPQDERSNLKQNIVAGRRSGSPENVTRDVPSNWDIASTPWPEQGRQHPRGQEDYKELSEWDSDYDSRSNDHFGDADNDDEEAEDLQLLKNKKNDEDPDRKKTVYTPELPVAGTMQESVYKSPNASDTDLNTRRELVEMKEDSPKAKHKTNAIYKEEAKEMEIKQRDTGAPVELKANPTVFMAHSSKNRVSPIDDQEAKQAKGNYYAVSEVERQKEKSRVFGGDQGAKQAKGNYYAVSEVEQQKKKSRVFGADDNTDGVGCCGWLLYAFSILLIVVSLPFSLIFCIKVVQEYERAVIFRLGRLPSGGAKGPGIFFIIPCIESYTKIDLRTVSFDVPPQEVLTKDSVTVSVDAVVYYRVSNPTVSVANVENAHHSTRLLAQTTLRNILGTKNMSEILSDRESISQGMQSTLDEATDNWGIKVERVEIKDVRLPVQLQRAMAAEAEAAREARAKVIAAEGEQKASHALKEAADVMAKSSAALQLRYLQTLSSISAEKNSTIIFPLPIDLVKAFVDKNSRV